jgi:AbrB family looped-hinge helix DNA binding protein
MLDKFRRNHYYKYILIFQINKKNLKKRGVGMAKKNERSCFDPASGGGSRCKVESLISVDERGQMVLPKEMREKANIRPGDKLALVSWEKNGKVCCITMIKADDFADLVKGLIGPMMKDMVETPLNR